VKKSILLSLAAVIAATMVGCASTKKEAAPQKQPASQPAEQEPAAAQDIPIDEPTVYDDPAAGQKQDEQSENKAASSDQGLEPITSDEGLIMSEPEPTVVKETASPQAAVPQKKVAAPENKQVANNTPLVQNDTKQTSAQKINSSPSAKTNDAVQKANTTQSGSSSSDQQKVAVPAEKPSVDKTDDDTIANTPSSIVAAQDTTPSRSIAMMLNQYLDVTYPGTGWVYLGELNNTNLLKYYGRKIDSSETTFSLRSNKAGSTVLHFYKNDVLTGSYIDDYLSVTVADSRSLSTDHVSAPAYAEYVPPRLAASSTGTDSQNAENTNADTQDQTISKTAASASSKNSSASTAFTSTNATAAQKQSAADVRDDDSGVQTVIQTTESSPAKQTEATSSATPTATTPAADTTATSSLQDTTALASDDILTLAQKSYDTGKYADALSYLDRFFDKAVTRVDEGLYLKGQTLEANSEVRNIKSALETYDTLVKTYPQSIDWEKANERITYLKRFYFNIR